MMRREHKRILRRAGAFLGAGLLLATVAGLPVAAKNLVLRFKVPGLEGFATGNGPGGGGSAGPPVIDAAQLATFVFGGQDFDGSVSFTDPDTPAPALVATLDVTWTPHGGSAQPQASGLALADGASWTAPAGGLRLERPAGEARLVASGTAAQGRYDLVLNVADGDHPTVTAGFGLGMPLQAKLVAQTHRTASDNLGSSVAIDGDVIVAGAYRHSADADGNPAPNRAGAAYVFRRDAGGQWLEEQKLVASTQLEQAYFGGAVAIDGNRIAVGAYWEPVGGMNVVGAVHVFDYQGGAWQHTAHLVAPDGAGSDFFGGAIALEGDRLIVGASHHRLDENDANSVSGAGKVYAYQHDGSSWGVPQELVAFPPEHRGGFFGSALALDGDTLAVSAHQNDWDEAGNVVNNSGAVYIFEHDGNGWQPQDKVTPEDHHDTAEFFRAVLDGDLLVVGAGGQKYPATGTSPEVDYAGAAYVFTRSGNDWVQQQKLTAPPGRESWALFGSTLALSPTRLAIVEPGEDLDADGLDAVNNAGAIYLYERNGTTIDGAAPSKIVSIDRRNGSEFALAVAMDGSTLVATERNASTDASGGSYAFEAGALFVIE